MRIHQIAKGFVLLFLRVASFLTLFLALPSVALSAAHYYDSNGLVLSSLEPVVIGRGELTTTPELKLLFNTLEPFNVINDEILPEILSEMTPRLFAEFGGDGDPEGVIFETELPDVTLSHVKNVEYAVSANDLVDLFGGWSKVIIPLADLDDENLKEDIDAFIRAEVAKRELFFYLTYKVDAKNLKLALDVDDFSLNLHPAGVDTLRVGFDFPNLQVTGDLDVSGAATINLDLSSWNELDMGWQILMAMVKAVFGSDVIKITIPLLDAQPAFTITGLKAERDAVLTFDSADAVVAVEEFGAVTAIGLNDLSFDTSAMDSEQKRIFEYGLDQYQNTSCQKGEELKDCVSSALAKTATAYVPDMRDGLNEAIAAALGKVLQLEKKYEGLGGLTVYSDVVLSAAQISDVAPYIATSWQADIDIGYVKDACASGVPDAVDTATEIDAYQSGNGDVEMVIANALPRTLLQAHAKSGKLCFAMSYTEPVTGEVFAGELVPDGALTFGSGEYEGVYLVWDNYDAFVREASESHDAHSQGSGQKTAMVANSAVLGGGRGTDYVLSVSSYTDVGLQTNLPVRFKASKTVLDQEVTIDIRGTMHLIGDVETDERNKVHFKIKKAWVDELAGGADSALFTIELADMAEQINEVLAATYYAGRVSYVTYSACPDFGQSRDAVTDYVVETTTRDFSCDEACDLPTGLKIAALSAYGYQLQADGLLPDNGSTTVVFNADAEDAVTKDGDCAMPAWQVDGFLNLKNQFATEQRAYNEVFGLILKGMQRELLTHDFDAKQILVADEFWQQFVIDESPDRLLWLEGAAAHRIESLFVKTRILTGDAARTRIQIQRMFFEVR